MGQSSLLKNYINGQWCLSSAQEQIPVDNPATADILATVPLSPAAEVERAAQAAASAFPEWRRVPPTERVQYLFKLKGLLEANREDLAQLVTQESGKTLAESRGELQ
ncbi:MAG: aldehyde dehydrogenase family protein, partial [Cyanobacteria bacterium Co-bin13]|nr:aldehyde dehydrogenase family protein [Cyanobacteria bacterium Co-bin13]